MKKLLLLLPLVLVLADPPAGFNAWTSDELKSQGEAVTKTMKDGSANKTVADWGNHQMLIVHREATGQAEFHAKQADLIIVRSGAGSIKIGGKIMDGVTTAPNEIRGTSIQGAELHPLKEGDVMHIPANTAHQVMLETGQKIEYLAIKVDAK